MSGESSIVNQVLPVAAEASVTFEKWVYGGDALGRVDGKVVLAPFIMPGETARVTLGDDVRSDLLEVTTPSPERIEPACPIFAHCGGCNYQYAPYEFQLARKVEILREQLRRVGKIDYTGEIATLYAEPFGYRNRVQLRIDNGQLGFLAARSHKFVPLTGECPISSPRLNQAITAMRARLHDGKFPRFVHSLELFTNETHVQVNVLEADRPVAKMFYDWCESVVAVDYKTAEGLFRVSPQSFFQVNRFLIEPLLHEVLGDVSGTSALDLYAGVGLFAIPLAKRFKKVTAVESGSGAARDLEVNEERAGLSNISIYRDRVEDFLRELKTAPDFVIADPPRAGLGKSVTAQLERLAPPRITVVSCDPATLARDLQSLANYKIERMVLVDLFPQTYHLETVVHLSRKA